MDIEVSRRALLAGGIAALASRASAVQKQKVSIFSKHLHFLQGEELAKAAAELGFDGLDITVRRNGHVEPERVRQDLPPLVAVIRKHGLEVPMVTTDVVDPDTPHAVEILTTIAELGIRNYRFMPSGGFKYSFDRPYAAQLAAYRPRIERLAALNARHQLCAMYHTHSGRGAVGASIWDLHILMKDVDPKHVAVNYDVAHATIEGGLGGWINSFQISVPHLGGIAVKDFVWAKNDTGEWRVEWQPLGKGMVRLQEFFGMLAKTGFSGPLQHHFEYPLGGANTGNKTLTMPKEEVFVSMKRDLAALRGYLAKANL